MVARVLKNESRQIEREERQRNIKNVILEASKQDNSAPNGVVSRSVHKTEKNFIHYQMNYVTAYVKPIQHLVLTHCVMQGETINLEIWRNLQKVCLILINFFNMNPSVAVLPLSLLLLTELIFLLLHVHRNRRNYYRPLNIPKQEERILRMITNSCWLGGEEKNHSTTIYEQKRQS